MIEIDPDYPLSIFNRALSSVAGRTIIFVAVCILAILIGSWISEGWRNPTVIIWWTVIVSFASSWGHILLLYTCAPFDFFPAIRALLDLPPYCVHYMNAFSVFRDLTALQSVLRAIESVPSDVRRDELVRILKEWKWENEQASLYASTVRCQNTDGSADSVATNGSHVVGSWIRGTQHGSAGAYLKSMAETWKFNSDLTYEHKTERYEGYTSLQFSYSRPRKDVERGYWAPPDSIREQIRLFVMDSNGYARTVTFEGKNKNSLAIGYQACIINGDEFGRKR